MKLIRLLRPVLFVYEVIRIVIITILLILKANDSSQFMMMIFAVQGVLFPIMALFLCLNTARYREYIPLYIAGKVIGISAILCWLLFTRQATMIGGIISDTVLGSFDMLAIAIILLIRNDLNDSSINNLLTSEQAAENEQNANTEVN